MTLLSVVSFFVFFICRKLSYSVGCPYEFFISPYCLVGEEIEGDGDKRGPAGYFNLEGDIAASEHLAKDGKDDIPPDDKKHVEHAKPRLCHTVVIGEDAVDAQY